jgi:RND family efflux transporter MFP subunit
MKIKTFFIFPLSLIIAIIILSFESCKNKAPKEISKENQQGTFLEKEKPIVSIMELKPGVFYKEILSNGKLYALSKADLKFRVSEEIEKINVKNGEEVPKGKVLAVVNSFDYYNQLQRAKIQYDKACTSMQDVLIAQGYNFSDSSRIAPQVWKIASDKSGLTEAKINLESAQNNYQNTTLKAPFKGVIANMRLKEHSMVSLSEVFCTLIDNSVFNAEFQVLESEIGNITLGQSVLAISFSADSIPKTGIVTEINPLVDENGLITVRAQIKNINKNLYEGMNVRITIRKACPQRLVLPKQAVLQRQGKEVVFSLENGHAIWNYVKTGDENSDYYTIVEGLKPGMKIIISNNLNIGHDAEVEVAKNE